MTRKIRGVFARGVRRATVERERLHTNNIESFFSPAAPHGAG